MRLTKLALLTLVTLLATSWLSAYATVKVTNLHLQKNSQFTEFTIDCDLVLLAMGFTGPVRSGLIDSLGVRLDPRGNVVTDATYMSSVPGVFAAGDMRRGQSLVVWAISEGRQAARAVDRFLMGEAATLL